MKDNLIWPVWLVTTHGLKKVFLGKKCMVVTQLTRMWCVCLWLGWEQSFKQKKWSKSVSHSVVSDFLWPAWTVARQAPLSMEFSRQEYWSGLPFPSPGDLPNPRDRTQVSCIKGRFFTNWAVREAQMMIDIGTTNEKNLWIISWRRASH